MRDQSQASTGRVIRTSDSPMGGESEAPEDRVVVVAERVSSDKQDITRQASVRVWAAEMYPGNEMRIIQDDGISAYKVPIFDRPGGREICDLIAAGRVAAVCADAQDRLCRGDDLEWVTFRTLCEANRTKIVLDGREMTDDMAGRLEGYLKSLLARQESVEKSRRVRGGKRASAEKGRRNGGPRPFGYEQRDGQLHVVAAERAVLHRIRAEILAGKTLAGIAEGLNGDRLRTTTGKKWTQARIGQMMRLRVYVGKVKNRDAEYDGNHEPIFTDAEWAELEAALAARRSRTGGRGGRFRGWRVCRDHCRR